jgi:biopolymer transport protein ExbB
MVGLQYADQPKIILEERLQAVLLEQRLHYERRLPLLAVIATAAPLMGLLGTVVGMVKTFALITVFGTGNAGKLSSGISEVLVATELGLAVAIPALVTHGFLAHRIQKNLSLLERYALQFTTAVETARVSPGGEPQRESVPA